MATTITDDQVAAVGRLLNNPERPLKERFRALFTLKNIGGPLALEWIAKAFGDKSALLKHEVAYCLGQLQDPLATPILIDILKDSSREAIVRHEAAEALGAIGTDQVWEVLEEYSKDPVPEVAETCQLAIYRVKWLKAGGQDDKSIHQSVDPAPPLEETDTEQLKSILLDESLPLFQRYRAMFSLRNKGDVASVEALSCGLKSSSALFRHEVAFVLGQVASPAAVQALSVSLADETENPMVRHECAEALGGIGSEGVETELGKYLGEKVPDLVRESCIIALDMFDYANSEEFQYANALVVA